MNNHTDIIKTVKDYNSLSASIAAVYGYKPVHIGVDGASLYVTHKNENPGDDIEQIMRIIPIAEYIERREKAEHLMTSDMKYFMISGEDYNTISLSNKAGEHMEFLLISTDICRGLYYGVLPLIGKFCALTKPCAETDWKFTLLPETLSATFGGAMGAGKKQPVKYYNRVINTFNEVI